MDDQFAIQAPVILGAVTIFGVLSWYLIPEHKWLRRSLVEQQLLTANEVPVAGASTVPELSTSQSTSRRRSEDVK